MNKLSLIILALFLTTACKNDKEPSDAYGNFEAVETIVSAEAAGKLLAMEVRQGDQIKAGQLVALIDTTELILRREQTRAQLLASETKKQNVTAQVNVLKEQKKNVQTTQERLSRMFSDKAATQQQMDDVNGQLNVLEKQIISTNSQFQLIASEMEVIDRQLDLLEEQLAKSRITSPISGTVLETYLETGELVTPGKPVLKMADLSKLELRAYVSGEQLEKARLGNEVKVLIDSADGQMQSFTGKISWISSEAEFTPRIIQTREERVKLMYALKIVVPNDGRLKIGMPAEVMF